MSDALPLYRAEQVRAIERAAAQAGIDSHALMRRAGGSAAALLRARWPWARRVGLLCGAGNNGGDGYVAALALHRVGLDVRVVAVADPATPEARAAAARWRETGQGVIDLAAALAAPLPPVDLWVDALFGTGLSRPPEAGVAALLAAIREQGRPVLALDLPSGIDADTGSAPGAFLPASLTLCFVAAKRGLFTATGREAAGELRLDPLDLPPEAFAEVPATAWAIAAPSLRGVLPRRRIDSHKGRHGRVLCIGGDEGMGGALLLCAEAAARAGAGAVLAWSRPAAVAALLARRPEVMVRVVEAGEDAAQDGHRLRDALEAVRVDVVALGPGLGQGRWGRALFEATLASGLPLVLDADALNLLAESPRPLPAAILTPHPGEAARLLGVSHTDVQADRFAAAAALAERFAAVVVLKGAGSLVAAAGATPRLVDAGNPGMASAGMGDLLTGVVAALRAQGLPPFEAAWAGALAHAVAADRAVAAAPRGLLAGDLLEPLRQVLAP